MWNGNSGTFTANPIANATKSHLAVASDNVCADDAQSVSCGTSNVSTSVACWCRNATHKMPANRNAEPAVVKRKNFIAA